jgi:hypothetical protein
MLVLLVRSFWLLALVSPLVLGVHAQAQELPLGAAMPLMDRPLQHVQGDEVRLSELRGERATVVVFWSNECAWTQRYDDRIRSVSSDLAGQGVAVVLVNPNDPIANPGEAVEAGRGRGYDMPYVMDRGSALARAFGATRTPHIYVFDASNVLVYVGTLDDSPGDAGNVQRRYLRDAITSILEGGPIETAQTRAYGCTIKFQSGGN